MPRATISVSSGGTYSALSTTRTTSTSRAICEGESLRLIAPLAEGNTYLWSTGATSPFIDVTSQGTYSVTVTNSAGCSARDSVDIVVKPRPSVVIAASGPTSFCAGANVTLTASGADTFVWSNGATSPSITVDSSGTYTVSGTTNGCSALSGPTTFCDGGSVTLTAGPAASYLWSTGETSASITVTASSTVTVTTTSIAGCRATSESVVITEHAPLQRPSVTPAGQMTVCPGGIVTLNATAAGGSAPYAYQWHHFGGELIPGATDASYTATPTTNDYCYVVVTDAGGCTSESSNAVQVSVSFTPSAEIRSDAAICAATRASAEVDAVEGATYTWTIADGTIVSQEGSRITFTSNAATVGLGVTVTSADGCSASGSKSINVNSTPAAAITASGPTTFCEGGSVTLTASSGASHLWSTGETTASIVVTSTGSYEVTVTDANPMLLNSYSRGDGQPASGEAINLGERPNDVLQRRKRHALSASI